MSKLIIFLIAGILWCNIVIAKEIRTRFGFYIDLPSSFIAIQDQNIGDIMKEYDGSEINKDFFNDFMKGSTKQDLNVEFYFPKNFDAELNSINLNYQTDASVDSVLNDVGLKDICPYYNELFEELFKRKINQYYCKFEKKFKPKFTNVIHTKHDGSVPGQIMIQYQFDVNKKMLTLTVGCEPKNCNSMQKTSEYIIKSIN
tara:strand:+ start:88 stop:687 length:600 start_codon:yes stop_codon:yes gene_type:complete